MIIRPARVHVAYLGYGVHLFRDDIQYWLVAQRDEQMYEVALTNEEIDNLKRHADQSPLHEI